MFVMAVMGKWSIFKTIRVNRRSGERPKGRRPYYRPMKRMEGSQHGMGWSQAWRGGGRGGGKERAQQGGAVDGEKRGGRKKNVWTFLLT